LAPFARRFPGFGLCATTRPFFLLVDVFRTTRPTLQCAFTIRVLARLSLKPTTFGTTHLGCRANVAVAKRSIVIESVQVAVPEQSPDHPVNLDPGAAVAESWTEAPWPNCAEQTSPQAIPAGELAIVPAPVPPLPIVRV